MRLNCILFVFLLILSIKLCAGEAISERKSSKMTNSKNYSKNEFKKFRLLEEPKL